jgi:membrane-bound lytic murein transglycosylase B
MPKNIGINFIYMGIIFLAFFVPFQINAQSLTPEQRAKLESELKQVEAEVAKAQGQLESAKAESASITRDINVLDARIRAAQLEIKAKNLLIKTLGNDIDQKEQKIDELEDRIEKGKAILSDIFRKTRELDDYSVFEIMLAQKSVSGFMSEMEKFQFVQNNINTVAEQLTSDRNTTEEEKNVLDQRRNAEIDARYVIQQKEAGIKRDQIEKQTLLNISKGNEQSYNNLIAEKNAKAAQIRAQLFSLRDSAAIPFGTALQYANVAYQKTGVRPAFLLAIIMQESDLGKNVGACYVTNTSTGDGVNIRSGNKLAKVMSPTRDIPPFLNILKNIGGDYARTPVSCPFTIGWGGAMGPAQFIPSTWVLVVDKVKNALGISSYPDPWNAQHAFMASALYLKDLGAGYGGYTAERNAACRYYSGRTCGLVPGNTTYGNSVITKANTIQTTMIDPLN